MFRQYGPPPADRDDQPMTQEEWVGVAFGVFLGLGALLMGALLLAQ